MKAHEYCLTKCHATFMTSGQNIRTLDNVNILINANYSSAVQMGSILLTGVCNTFGRNVS